MARLPQPRAGSELVSRGRTLPFSFFPVTKGVRRYGLYDAVFAVNPWSVIRGTINNELTAGDQVEALAFVEQAEDFYRAASAGLSTNPLLLYYAFLNLGKALIRVRGHTGSLDRAMHGLKEETSAGGTELKDSTVVAKGGGSGVNVFPELVSRLGFHRPPSNARYPVTDLLPQVVVGHRIWREASAANKERFIDLKHLDFVHDKTNRAVWLRLFVSKGDLSRYEIPRARLLREGGIERDFQEVKTESTGRDPALACFEQRAPVTYTGRPNDVVADVVARIRPNLWRIVSALPGGAYRRYYLHVSPPGTARLPQLASLWALFFYFGSVVRYRPHLFDELLRAADGAFIAEFISSQPEQMLYMLASELCQREIARPAIV